MKPSRPYVISAVVVTVLMIGAGFLPLFGGPGYEHAIAPRQKIPGDLLCRNTKAGRGPPSFRPGLEFAAYNGEWGFLPDFAFLTPVAEGVATNVSLAYRARPEQTALVFSGFIKIRHPGIYTFYLTSDDGSRLAVGHPAVSCAITPGSSRAVPVPETFHQALADRRRSHWLELKGEVAFAGQGEGHLEMNLVERGNHLPVQASR